VLTVRENQEGRMINSTGAEQFARPFQTRPLPGRADLDDDEDAAELDDDDDELQASPWNDRWFAFAGFGSPEWWSHH
jgi:hypothetical protein